MFTPHVLGASAIAAALIVAAIPVAATLTAVGGALLVVGLYRWYSGDASDDAAQGLRHGLRVAG